MTDSTTNNGMEHHVVIHRDQHLQESTVSEIEIKSAIISCINKAFNHRMSKFCGEVITPTLWKAALEVANELMSEFIHWPTESTFTLHCDASCNPPNVMAAHAVVVEGFWKTFNGSTVHFILVYPEWNRPNIVV